MSKEENTDLKEIKEYLLGTEFDRKKGVQYKIDCIDDRLCKIENRLHNIEKRKTFVGGLKSLIMLFAK